MAAAVATYTYSVRNRSGALVSGTMEGESSAVVATKLKAMGYAPVKIKAEKSGMKTEIKIPGFGGGVKLKELAVLARQFATMINSGLSLMRALSILTEQQENSTLKNALADVRNEVETGTALSVALMKYKKIFPPIMVNLVKAGEVGGFLDGALLQVATNFEAEVKLRGKIKSAMAYPMVVFVFAVIALIGMLLFIVPVFAKIFTSIGAKLPAPTQILMSLSTGLKKGLPEVIVLGIVFIVLWKKFKHTDQVRNVLDPLKIKLPVFGPLFQKVALGRFCRNLGTMMRAGVPILQALDIVGETSGNIVLTRATVDVQASVRTGESLAAPLEKHPVFPAMTVQMIAVGEETGALDEMLAKVSEFYDQQVEATTEALTSLIEPLMIAVIGSMIGTMVICLYLPMFSIYNHIS